MHKFELGERELTNNSPTYGEFRCTRNVLGGTELETYLNQPVDLAPSSPHNIMDDVLGQCNSLEAGVIDIDTKRNRRKQKNDTVQTPNQQDAKLDGGKDRCSCETLVA